MGILASILALAALTGSPVSAPREYPLPEIVHVEWTPPESKLKPEYVKAVQLFLGNGLADPRGGTFGVITTPVYHGIYSQLAKAQKTGLDDARSASRGAARRLAP